MVFECWGCFSVVALCIVHHLHYSHMIMSGDALQKKIVMTFCSNLHIGIKHLVLPNTIIIMHLFELCIYVQKCKTLGNCCELVMVVLMTSSFADRKIREVVV